MDIPLIDLALWTDGSEEDRAAVAAALDAAFSTVGFLVLLNHGLDPELAAGLRRAALDFFGLPDSAKEHWAAGELGDPGWVARGREANGYVVGLDTPPDLKETFVVHRHEPAALAGSALSQLGHAHLEAATAVYEKLVELCARALGLDDPSILVGPCIDAPNSLSINWYPSIGRVGPPTPGQFRIGPHTDFGTLTLLDREPGLGCLQVELADGTWVDAPHVEGALIVNAADLLAMWSGGRWRSASHRVPPSLDAPAEELVSLVCFCEPRADALIAPLPGTPGESRFEPVVAGAFLAAKLAAITVTSP